jgi:hypothetical protein
MVLGPNFNLHFGYWLLALHINNRLGCNCVSETKTLQLIFARFSREREKKFYTLGSRYYLNALKLNLFLVVCLKTKYVMKQEKKV